MSDPVAQPAEAPAFVPKISQISDTNVWETVYFSEQMTKTAKQEVAVQALFGFEKDLAVAEMEVFNRWFHQMLPAGTHDVADLLSGAAIGPRQGRAKAGRLEKSRHRGHQRQRPAPALGRTGATSFIGQQVARLGTPFAAKNLNLITNASAAAPA